MNIFKLLMIFILAAFSTNALAYGSSSSKKACTKPKFTEFSPVHLSVVAAQSEFSFKASSLTSPESIKVSVKKQPVEVTINKMNNGYSVTGQLPASLQNTYARVDIKATGTNKCKANDGWLLKIEN
jgi:hypothetical protein